MTNAQRLLFLACIFGAIISGARAAPAQAGNDNMAARHGIVHAVPIALPCAINAVPRFDSGGEEAKIAAALTPYGDNRAYVVSLGEASNLITVRIDDPADRKPTIFQTLIPVKDNAGNSTTVIVASRSDAAQRIAFLRANFDARQDMSEVIFVTANRIGGAGAPADIMVYRLHEDPIIDGEIVYFAPAFSWQMAAFATATEALEAAFAVHLSPDGSGACMQ